MLLLLNMNRFPCAHNLQKYLRKNTRQPNSKVKPIEHVFNLFKIIDKNTGCSGLAVLLLSFAQVSESLYRWLETCSCFWKMWKISTYFMPAFHLILMLVSTVEQLKQSGAWARNGFLKLWARNTTSQEKFNLVLITLQYATNMTKKLFSNTFYFFIVSYVNQLNYWCFRSVS